MVKIDFKNRVCLCQNDSQVFISNFVHGTKINHYSAKLMAL